jgi:hypothetical protein
MHIGWQLLPSLSLLDDVGPSISGGGSAIHKSQRLTKINQNYKIKSKHTTMVV